MFSSFFESAQKAKARKDGKDDDVESKEKGQKGKDGDSGSGKKKKEKASGKADSSDHDERSEKSTLTTDKHSQSKGDRRGDKTPRRRRRNKQEEATDFESPAKKPRREGPSQEALDVSRQLQALSRQKRLQECLNLYWSTDDRDIHHACIVVDCCARSGSVAEAERVAGEFDVADTSVELQTALLKAYGHAGHMRSACRVFDALFMARKWSLRPNVRTLNTFLRGCLWTASTVPPSPARRPPQKSKNTTTFPAGGVASSEHYWNKYTQRFGKDSPPDTSSYEATVIILAQGLRVELAQERIDQFQESHGIKVKGLASIHPSNKGETIDQSVWESLAVLYLALERSCALMGTRGDDVWRAGQRALQAIQASRKELEKLGEQNATQGPSTGSRAGGGKRGWNHNKNNNAARTATSEDDERRRASNLAYRGHRLSEMETEVKLLLSFRANAWLTPETLAERLLTKCFYFSGGGTTELNSASAEKDKKRKHGQSNSQKDEAIQHLLTPIWLSFGLSAVSQSSKDGRPPRSMVSQYAKAFDPRGYLKMDRIFDHNPEAPLDVELGSGSGDWIVSQAQGHSNRNYLAVELRADRAHQIFAKGTLNGVNSEQRKTEGKSRQSLPNLCTVAAEAGDFLSRRVTPKSLSTVFVNHPEPPTQTYGEDSDLLNKVESGAWEPAHLLCSKTLEAALEALKAGGRMVIVTDNRWYARLICVTVGRLAKEPNSLVDTKALQSAGKKLGKSGFEEAGTSNGIPFWEGQPNQAIGHVTRSQLDKAGTSYFDRLWRTGASNHASKTERYIVLLHKRRNDSS